ncbi:MULTISPECIES: DUF4191 domain-containing protein [Citricoccus]|uniref:DUF4191 domain-containing protein n=1 Tax=Citricoccus muralis TaxID=169134 RepID=A0ABY8H394_9MICC|nr:MULTISPECIES: DUF4191 domain-containing protein [Citricoccus]WBL18137.1 DUF4191 domain-containing protein [Citricoccus sp. NR2]WFP15481.1 DUF4191 domain-containing protein [Citricoccus muralis]
MASNSNHNDATPARAPQKDLKTVKREQRERRAQEKALAKATRAEKKAAKKNKKGFFKQIAEVFSMTRKHDKTLVLWMVLAFVIALVVGLGVGLLLNNWITWLLISIPFGLLAALIVMNRKAERAAYAQIEGRPGAAGAALSNIGRGWVVPQEPVAMNAKTQDAVYRAVGRPGVVLVGEGGYERVKKLADQERRKMARYLPNVEIRIVQVGKGPSEIELHEIKPTLKRMKKTLTKHEVRAVENRLASLPSNKLPIPKGIDPYRMRPDRKAMRGR